MHTPNTERTSQHAPELPRTDSWPSTGAQEWRSSTLANMLASAVSSAQHAHPASSDSDGSERRHLVDLFVAFVDTVPHHLPEPWRRFLDNVARDDSFWITEVNGGPGPESRVVPWEIDVNALVKAWPQLIRESFNC